MRQLPRLTAIAASWLLDALGCSDRIEPELWEFREPVSSECASTWSSDTDFEHAEWVWQETCDVGSAGWHEPNWYRLAFETSACMPGR